MSRSDNRESHECDAVCAQAHYDSAARDHLNRLDAMTPQEREAYWRKEAWVDAWVPEPSTRCPKCGETVMELKWSATHTEWQCLEPTCRNQWEWRKS